jgi:hypothetical protein
MVENRSQLLNFYSRVGHSCELGVGHSYDLPPSLKLLKLKVLILCLSYDLQMVTGTGRVGRSSPLCGKRRPARTGPVSSVNKASAVSVSNFVY